MPLTASLTAGFGADGFDLATSFGGLAGALTGIDLPTSSLSGGVGGVLGGGVDGAGGLGSLALDDVVGALTAVLDRVGGIAGSFPDLATVLGPLQSAMHIVDLLTVTDIGALVEDLEAALAPAGVGLAAVVTSATRIGQVPAVHALLDATGPLGLDLRAPGALIGGPAGGAVSLVQLVGALLGVDTASREIERRARLVVDLLAVERIQALVTTIGTGTGIRLAALLDGIDPNDALLVDTIAMPIEDHLGAVRALLTLLVRGLGFAEATLVDSDVAGLAAELTLASVGLSSSAVGPVGELVATIRGVAGPFVALTVPDLGGAMLWTASANLATQIGTAIDGIAADALHTVVEPLLGPLLTPVRAVRSALDQLESIVRTAVDPVRSALDAIDLTPVARTIDAVVQPISDGVTAIAGLISGAQTEIDGVVGAVDAALAPVRQTLLDARDTIATPFTTVADAIGALDLASLQQTAEATLGSVAAALGSVPIQPVFDVATGIVDTAADALGLVPRALLPDDVKSALEAACAPVESLDLEPLRAELHDRLQQIIAGVDATALDAVQAGYAEVQAFVASIDPRPHVEALEQQAFTELTERLAAIDPTAIIAPVTAVLDAARGALAGIDLHALLAPVEDALDTVEHGLQALSPDVLLAPIESILTAARATVEETLHLSTWGAAIIDAESAVSTALGRLDPAPLFASIRDGWAQLVEMIRPRPDEGRLLPSLLGAALAGAPFDINPAGLTAVLRWIRGDDDGAASVRDRLRRAAAALTDARTALDRLDVARLTTDLDQGHRALLAALAAHPADSLLADRLAAAIAASSPTQSLGLILSNVREVARLTADAQQAVTATLGPDRSEVTLAATGLGAAFRPLQPIVDTVRRLLVAVGADPGDPDPRAAIANLLDRLGPDDVLGPFEAVATAVLARVDELVHEGIVAPLQAGVADLQAVLGALGVDTLTGGLTELHASLVATVDGLRPTTVLAAPLAAFDEVRSLLDGFDPLAPVQAAIDALRGVVTGFADEVRPTVLLEPVLHVYDQLAGLIGAFDVAALLDPILTTLQGIGVQIDHGMDGVIDALGRLRTACESDGGPLPGLDLSVASSVATSADLGGIF